MGRSVVSVTNETFDKEVFKLFIRGLSIPALKGEAFRPLNPQLCKLYKNVDNPREYLIYSEWKDLDSFRKFMLSREFKNTTDYGKQIIEGRPYHRIFQEINA
ncbi:hypothetical protein GFB69_10180 [Acidianus ambivalens]|uniref:ABM domain-containing protein n=1 Tax=Acidianus ambivalens TaxID=2283 RepID=A0A650CYC5_ACIAM|nr:hypothetical protein [Acidianus ambivalens]QGR22851.1 hypothetical protein D1866_04645 [Acidianus ambivalens]